MDNRTFKRVLYEVLDHNPTHADIECFFLRFKAALDVRGLMLKGITTDGSPLYPEPLRRIFGDVPHQICEFHVLADITAAILTCRRQSSQETQAGNPEAPPWPPQRQSRTATSTAKQTASAQGG